MTSSSFIVGHHAPRHRSLSSLVRDLTSTWRRAVPTVLSVGLGGSNNKPIIYVYTSRRLTKRERAEIPHSVDGVDVVIKETGRIVPAPR